MIAVINTETGEIMEISEDEEIPAGYTPIYTTQTSGYHIPNFGLLLIIALTVWLIIKRKK